MALSNEFLAFQELAIPKHLPVLYKRIKPRSEAEKCHHNHCQVGQNPFRNRALSWSSSLSGVLLGALSLPLKRHLVWPSTYLLITDGNTYTQRTKGEKEKKVVNQHESYYIFAIFLHNEVHNFFKEIPSSYQLRHTHIIFPWPQVVGIIRVKILRIYFALGKERRGELCMEV